jgi:hypothetical protein
MGIVVKHDEPSAALGGIIPAVGQARSADKQSAADEARARWVLGYKQNQQQFGENQRQFDVNAALRLRGQDIEQRQYQQNLARQDATQQNILANQEANRNAQLYATQMREEYDMAQQQQEQMFQYAADSMKTVDQQVMETVKASQQMKLNPEGQRILNEKMGKLREIQQYKGTVRPGAYASLLDQWHTDYQTSGLDAYEIQEPSAAEKVYNNLVPLQGQQIEPGQPLPPGTYRSLKGVRNGVESWETITIPEPVSPTFAEDAVKNWAPAPDGGFFMRQPDGKMAHVPPAKPEKPAAVKPTDFGKYIKEATTQLINEHSSANPESTASFSPKSEDIKKKARKLWQLERELEAELGEGGGGGEDSSEESPPVSVNSMEEAMQVPVGSSFIYNGQAFIVTGPGEAEPL